MKNKEIVKSIVVLVVSFIVIYFVTSSLVNPLRQMAAATRAFAKGEKLVNQVE